MRIRAIFTAILLVAALAPPGWALDTEELLALIAMPLVVDEVAEMTDVPEDRLAAALAAFAGADLRPTRYVEVVQYTPVALAYDARTGDTDFVRYVQEVRSDGLVGDPFYDAVTTYYVDTYGIPREVVRSEPVFLSDGRMVITRERLVSPAVRTVVREIHAAPSVTRTIITDANWSAPALGFGDLVALMAMPLITNELADMTDLPEDRLVSALAALAGADLRPTRYVEVVQYLPVALTYDLRTGDTDFVRFVRNIRSDGLIGDPFYDAVTTFYVDNYGIPREVIGLEPLFLRDEPTVVFRDTLLSPVVQTVVRDIRSAPAVTRTIVADADWSAHPHGGPPGQLKKQLGLQTGAEVVHGTDRRETRIVERRDRDRVIVDRDDDRDRGRRVTTRAERPEKERPAKVNRGEPRREPPARASREETRREPPAKVNRGKDRGKPDAKQARPDDRGQKNAPGKSGKQGKGNKKKDDRGTKP